MNINRELTELLGLCWHRWEYLLGNPPNEVGRCSCGKFSDVTYMEWINIHAHNNPDFASDPGKIELLRLMMKREDWSKFLFTINKIAGITVWGQNFIFVRYITDTTGLLARAAVEFLRREKYIDRTHEECADCSNEKLNPPQCHGHIAGPSPCRLFKEATHEPK
jgi:hypothetical protein